MTRSMPFVLLLFLCAATVWAPGVEARRQGPAQGPVQNPAGLTPVDVRLQWRHQWQFAGFYTALEQGYYREAGLDVTLHEFTGDVDIIDEVLSGRVQFGTHPSDLLTARMQGLPVVLLATYFRRSPLVLAARGDLFLPSDLRGKRIMAARHEIESTNFRYMFSRFGMTISDLEIVPHDFGIDALANGDVDAITAYGTNEIYLLHKQGIDFNVIDPGDYGPPHPDVNLFTSEALVAEHPGLVADMIEATNRGWAYALEHPAETISLIHAKYNSQRKSVEHLRFEAHQTHSVMMPEIYGIGLVDAAQIERLQNLIIGLGPMTDAVDMNRFIFSEDEAELALTDSEAELVREHRTVRVHFAELEPYVFSGDDGPAGYAVELLERLAQRAGLRLVWKAVDLDRALADLEAGRADLTVNLIRSPEREAFLSFSERDYAVRLMIFARRGEGAPRDLASLAGKTVAGSEGYAVSEMLRASRPDIDRLSVPSFRASLAAVSDGRADAAILPLNTGAYLLSKHLIDNVQIVGEARLSDGATVKAHHFAVRKDLAVLRSVLDKAYRSLDPTELQRLWARWFSEQDDVSFLKPEPALALTPSEREWLRRNREFLALYPEIPPFGMTENGTPRGYTIELMRLAARYAGLNVRFESAPQAEAIRRIEAGDADVLLNLVHERADAEALRHSDLYGLFEPRIFRGASGVRIDAVGDLAGRRVARPAGTSMPEGFAYLKPAPIDVQVGSAMEALRAVADGQADAVVMERRQARYLIAKHAMSGLVESPRRRGDGLAVQRACFFAAGKHNAPLAGILNKALAAIPAGEIQQIYESAFGETASWYAPIALDARERSLLLRRPLLEMVYFDAPPYAMEHDGAPAGYSIDLLTLAAQRLGFEVRARRLSGAEALAAVREGKADLVVDAAHNDGDAPRLRYGAKTVDLSVALFVRDQDRAIQRLEDLSGKRVAVRRDDRILRSICAECEGIEPVPVDSDVAALRMISDGQADATLMEPGLARYLLARQLIHHVREVPITASAERVRRTISHFAVNARDDLLADMLDRGIDSITPGEMQDLHRRWFGNAMRLAPTLRSRVRLTGEELAFLRERKDIVMGVEQNSKPFVIENSDGSQSGVDADTVEVLNAVLGTAIRLETGDPGTLLERAQRREIDGLSASVPDRQASARLTATQPYSDIGVGVYVAAGNPLQISSPADLAGKRIGYLPDVEAGARKLAQTGGVFAIPLDRRMDLVNGLLSGKLDAVIAGDSIEYLLADRNLTAIQLAFMLEETLPLTFAIRSDWPLLVSAIDKVLTALPEADRTAIKARYLPTQNSATASWQLPLSAAERDYLYSKGSRLRYCFSPVWRPLDYLEEGEHRGLFREYLNVLASKLGITLEPVVRSSWAAAVQAAEAGDCDLVSGMVATPERRRVFSFTAPYVRLTNVLVARDTEPFVSGIGALSDRVIGVPEASAISLTLRRRYPGIELRAMPTMSDATRAVLDGQVYAAVATLEHAAEMIDASFGGLRIIGELDDGYPISVAVRKDQPVLLGIMDKAVASLSEAERDLIAKRQTRFTIERYMDPKILWQVLAAVLLFAGFFGYRQLELTRLNRQLVAARDAAETAGREKGRFLTNMSHDIRTPMNAIVGMTRLCLDTDLQPRQRYYLERIGEAGHSMLGLINDLLDLSRMEAGKAVLHEQPFDLDEVLERLYGIIGLEAGERGLDLGLDVDPQAPRALLGDARRLEQALMNLLGNALKFTQKGSIDVRVETVRRESEAVVMRFSVIDTGVGIGASQKELLFRPFAQGEASLAHRHEGSGLGLAIAKELIQMMQGEIDVDSVPGKGSTFSFTARFGIESCCDAVSLWRLPEHLRGSRVMLLEAREWHAAALERMLRAFQLDVLRVSDGAELAFGLRDSRGGRRFPLLLANADLLDPDIAQTLLGARRMAEGPQGGLRLVLLASKVGEIESSAHLKDVAADAVLPMPVSRARLFDTLCAVLAHGPPAVTPAVYPPEPAFGDLLGGRRVLLVEDNMTNQVYAKEMLVRAGMEVVCAANGQQAVRRAASERFDLILMDLQMPVMDGYDAARAIRNQSGNASLPIIAMTAHARDEDRQMCIDAGMNDHVAKPIDPDLFFEAIERCLGKAASPPRARPSASACSVESQAPGGRAADSTEAAPRSVPAPGGPLIDNTNASLTGAIDFAAGLAVAGDDPAFYQRLLRTFFDGHRHDPELIELSLAGGDLQQARRVAHGLKGLAGMLGAGPLQRSAELAMDCCRDGDDVRCRVAIEQMTEHLREVLAVLEQALGTTPPPLDETRRDDHAGA
ncbi:MAG: transporter substrate-binding domain-containing protein [Thiohalocapsa sp.]|nr:transporter substrate-binding domain-containing protein [Thiohalocapsa sp.]